MDRVDADSDQVLVHRSAGGDPGAFASLVRRTNRPAGTIKRQLFDAQPGKGWTVGQESVIGRLTPEEAQWLAVFRVVDGERRVYTFLADDFDREWGRHQRRLEDGGRFVEGSPGVFRQTSQDAAAIGYGVFRVTVGKRRATCLRVLYPNGAMENDHTTLVEAFLTRGGETMFQRHYCQRRCAESAKHVLDEATKLRIDAAEFVHWYDVVFGE